MVSLEKRIDRYRKILTRDKKSQSHTVQYDIQNVSTNFQISLFSLCMQSEVLKTTISARSHIAESVPHLNLAQTQANSQQVK